jgi:prophage regulatory protein
MNLKGGLMAIRTQLAAQRAAQPTQELRLLRLGAVLARFGIRRTNLYDRISQELMTAPVKLGRSSAWPSDECDAILGHIIAGKTDSELRVLVQQLMAARTE